MSGGRAETGPPERKQRDCDFESVFSGTGYVTEKNSSNWAGVRIDLRTSYWVSDSLNSRHRLPLGYRLRACLSDDQPLEILKSLESIAPRSDTTAIAASRTRLGLRQDGDVGVRVFPEREEVSVCGFRLGGVTGLAVGSSELEMR